MGMEPSHAIPPGPFPQPPQQWWSRPAGARTHGKRLGQCGVASALCKYQVRASTPLSLCTSLESRVIQGETLPVAGTVRRGLYHVVQDSTPRCVPKRNENMATQNRTPMFPLFKMTNRWKLFGHAIGRYESAATTWTDPGNTC